VDSEVPKRGAVGGVDCFDVGRRCHHQDDSVIIIKDEDVLVKESVY